MTMDRREALKLLGLTLMSLALGRPSQLLAGTAITGSDQLGLFRQSRLMMGGIPVSLTVVAERESAADQALVAAFEELERLERLFSVYRPESEMSRLNAAAGRRPVTVSKETFALIEMGLMMNRMTEGGFHMGLGPAIALWDVLDHPRIPSQQKLNSLRPFIHDGAVRLDQSSSQVFLTKKGMRLDPGGIGKGYLSEQAKQVLLQHGIKGGLIAAAGDVVVFGQRPDGSPWKIGVQHPRHRKQLLTTLDLSDMAISTSGDYERFFMKDGVRYHHILDPQTLSPARLTRSVTILSPDGTRADALATGMFVLGPQRAFQLLLAQNIQGIIIDSEGHLHASPTLLGKLKFNL